MRRKIILESAVFGVLFGILFTLGQVILAMWMTYNAVPELPKGYENAEVLQTQVDFGYTGSFNVWLAGALFLLSACLYALVRWFFARLHRSGR